MKTYDYQITFHNQERYSKNPKQLEVMGGNYLDTIKGVFDCTDDSITGELVESDPHEEVRIWKENWIANRNRSLST